MEPPKAQSTTLDRSSIVPLADTNINESLISRKDDSVSSSTEVRREAYLTLQARYRFAFLALICGIELGRSYCLNLTAPHQKTIIKVREVSKRGIAIWSERSEIQHAVFGLLAT
ncbi:MAG: hypothetical protein P4M11_13450 [Candidatus Pacebacteria bacterium]|nr:hypothetical protein [Candidatus Paceibacterota bacterium]